MKKFWKKKPKKKEKDKPAKKSSNTIYILIIALSGMGAETVYTDVLEQEIFPSATRIQQQENMNDVQQEILLIKQQQFKQQQQLQQQQTQMILSAASHEELPHIPESHTHDVDHQHEFIEHDHVIEFIEHDHEILPEVKQHTHDVVAAHEHDNINNLNKTISSINGTITSMQIDIQDYRDKVSRGEIGGGSSGGGLGPNAVNTLIESKLKEFESENNSLLQTLLDRITRVSIIQDDIADRQDLLENSLVADVEELGIEVQSIDDKLDEILAFLTINFPHLCNPGQFNSPGCL